MRFDENEHENTWNVNWKSLFSRKVKVKLCLSSVICINYTTECIVEAAEMPFIWRQLINCLESSSTRVCKDILPGHIPDDAQKTLSDSVMRLKKNQLNESKIFYSNTSKEAQQRENELARRQHGRGGRRGGLGCKMSLQHWTSTTR